MSPYFLYGQYLIKGKATELNEMPVTAAQVGEGMTKAASVLEMAGASFEQATGMITGGGAITQDFDAFGNAIRVSALRVRGMKGELEELGEEVDDNISSVSKVQTQILNLTKGKVNIFKSDNETFRNIYDIYSDIAKIYNELNDKDKASLLEILAGKNRSNQIQGMLKAWSDVEKATEKASNAEGTAAAENEKYMQSMQGKLDSLNASWQALSNTVLSSDFVKFLVDGLSGIVDIVDGITHSFGVLGTAIAAVGITAFIKNLD